MTKFKNCFSKLMAVLLVCLMLLGDFALVGVQAKVESVDGSDSLVRTSLAEIEKLLTSVSYSEYLRDHWNVKDATQEIVIDLSADLSEDSTATVDMRADGYENSGCPVLLMGDDGKLVFNIDVPETAMYSVYIEYWTGDIEVLAADGSVAAIGKSADIERVIYFDDAVSYKETRSLSFTRAWKDVYTKIEDGNKKTYFDSVSDYFLDFVRNQENMFADSDRLFPYDSNGNEAKPTKEIYGMWASTYVYDTSGYSYVTEYKRDENDDLVPANEEDPYYYGPLKYYLTEGAHTFNIEAITEPMAIKSIVIKAAEKTLSYEEYIAKHEAAGAKDYTGEAVKIQAEYPVLTSDRTLYQINDRKSSISEPQDSTLIRYNSIGSNKWQYVGQWIEYTVVVEESGFYNIIPRSKQEDVMGSFVSRMIYIDDEIPFEEAKDLRFNYSTSWKTDVLNNGKQNFKFYLEEGEHTIRFQVVLGDMSGVLGRVSDSLSNLNEYYKKILMITGAEPDENRDYKFHKLIPDVIKGLAEEAVNLNNIANDIIAISGSAGDQTGTLLKVAVIVERMGKDPTQIAGYMDTLKEYTATLGTWLSDNTSQPLLLDYISIQAVDADAPKAEAGFFASMWAEILKFIGSFSADYNSIGSLIERDYSSEELQKCAIDVWTASSREDATIIRNLVDDSFNEKYNIPVNVKLVVGSTLLPATLARTGPDVYMGAGQSDPVNYAIRSAVYSLNSDAHGYNFNDLSKWEDHPVYGEFIDEIATFDEVTERFAPAAMVPFTLYGEAYGIADTMSFSMMFYRKDLFVELGLEVPNTWDDFYDLIYTMQSNSLDIGFPQGTGGSFIWAYQQNDDLFVTYTDEEYDYYLDQLLTQYSMDELKEMGWVYTDSEGKVRPKIDGMEINIGSNVMLETFKKVCELFTDYDFPYSYSIATRFRQGIMPLAIADYTSTYNTMVIFAPEIAGLWEFTPLPGTYDAETETINNSTIAGVSSLIMMNGVTDENALAAWTFMQWWSSADVQSEFGNEKIALLGPSAKYATANVEALQKMSWSKDELDNLVAQFNAVECTPEYPGSYIIGRFTSFAFLGAYNNGDNPVEKMRSYIDDINNELTRKRGEFNLPTTGTFNDIASSNAKS